MPHICLVEDEEKVAAFIIKGLQEQGFTVTHARDGLSAKQLFQSDDKFDLLILDLMLPDISGVEVCHLVRGRNSVIPILMLTALNRVDDKVSGLDAGADDYLVKPFHFKELMARINALLRRARPELPLPQPESMLTFSDLKLNLLSKTAERDGTEIILTSKEYQLLEMFMRNPNRTLSRDDIADKVWGITFRTGTNFIDVYVNYLRNKIERGFGGKLIHTVIGMGYILKKEKQA